MNSPSNSEPVLDRGKWVLPLWQSYLLLSFIWVFIGTLFALQLIWMEKFPVKLAVQLAALDWVPWIGVSPLVLWWSDKVQISGRTWKWALPLHVLACVVVILLLEIGPRFAFNHGWVDLKSLPGFPAGMPRPGSPRGELPMSPAGLEHPFPLRMIHARFQIPIYWVLIAAIHALAYHRRNLHRERRFLQAEAQLAEARLAALQAQINPHFLFNTLNTIALFVHENPAAAEEMVEALSELLRVVLAASHRREVSLLEELAFVDRYLAIQKHRFAGRIEVRREIAADVLHARVPTLLLQPLVENAVVHGITHSFRPGTLIIRALLVNGRLVLEVADTGDEKQPSRPAGEALLFREGLGVGNTRARLRTLYGEDFSFTLSAAPEGGVCSRIELPFHRSTAV